jgi:two-component system, NarL family, response regulator LiaR
MSRSTSSSTNISVLLADDHKLFRQGLRQICEFKGGFEVVGEAENGQQAVRMAEELKPDVILMDINMPVMNGIAATELILSTNKFARIIILTMYRHDRYSFDAIKAGAKGYLLKTSDAEVVIEAVRAVQRGEALVDPLMTARILDEFRRLSNAREAPTESEQLTDGEMQVLELVSQGEENQQIADRLHLSVQTVANRLRSIYKKMGVDNRTSAVLLALRRGWVSLDPENE